MEESILYINGNFSDLLGMRVRVCLQVYALECVCAMFENSNEVSWVDA